MDSSAILMLDEMVKNKKLFYLNVVLKNIHSSTRYISSLKKGYQSKTLRFYMLLVYYMSISDQIETVI